MLADQAMTRRLDNARAGVEQVMRLANSLSYQGVLERGFALVRDLDDRPLKRAHEVKPGQAVRVQFADDSVGAITTGKSATGTKSRTTPVKEPGKQGTLF